MPVSIACPKCKTKYRLPDSALGKPVKCQKCGASFRTSAPPQIAGKPAPSQQLSTKKAQPQTAVSKVLQPSQQDISKMGIQGTIKKQADIFSAPPPPTRSNPLGNFSIEDPGFADLEVAKQEVQEEVKSDGMESILGNPYASGPAKKSKGGMKRKSQAPAVDVRPYGVARIGIWMQLISWCLLLGAAVVFLLIALLGLLMPPEQGSLISTVLGIIILIIGIATPFAGLIAFVGQFLCLFAPNKDEKWFAGLAIGSLVGLIVLPIVILLVGVVGAAGLSVVSGASGQDAEEAGRAAGGLFGFAIVLSPVALLLANVLFMFLFFQRLGRNIKAKAVEQAAKLAMGSWIGSVANVVIFFIFIMVVAFLYRGGSSEVPGFMGSLLQIWSFLTMVLNVVVVFAMVAMGFAAVKHTKVV